MIPKDWFNSTSVGICHRLFRWDSQEYIQYGQDFHFLSPT